MSKKEEVAIAIDYTKLARRVVGKMLNVTRRFSKKQRPYYADIVNSILLLNQALPDDFKFKTSKTVKGLFQNQKNKAVH